MENYLDLLPKDIINIVNKLNIENSPGNKFLILMEKTDIHKWAYYKRGFPDELKHFLLIIIFLLNWKVKTIILKLKLLDNYH